MNTILKVWKTRCVLGINYQDENGFACQSWCFVNHSTGMELKKQITAMRKRLSDDEVIGWFVDNHARVEA